MTKHKKKEFNDYLFSYSNLMIYNKLLSGSFNVTLLIIILRFVQLKKKVEEGS